MTMYGTPEAVRFCTRCVISNQRPSSVIETRSRVGDAKPTIAFTDGICDACVYAERRMHIDWSAREEKLQQLCNEHRSVSGNYDVVVCGSGGKDSAYTAHVLKTKYRMHPLLVTWAPHLYTDIGLRNLRAWQSIADHYLVTPSSEVHRKLSRIAFDNLLHCFQPFIIGQKQVGPRLSAMLGIPLVMYGEMQAERGNPVDQTEHPEMDASFYADDGHGLVVGGVDEPELERVHGITPDQLNAYRPVDAHRLRAAGTTVRYLSWYLGPWKSQDNYYYAARECGFEANDQRTEGTYSKLSSIDDKLDTLFYWTGLIKFGIARATYNACEDLRDGYLTREEAVALVKKYDCERPRRYLADCLQYLALTEAEFDAKCDAARPDHIWDMTDTGWKLKHTVYE